MCATGWGRMQFMILCKEQNKTEDYSTERPKYLVTPAEMWATANFISLRSHCERNHERNEQLRNYPKDCFQYLDKRAATDREVNELVREVFQQSFGKETFPNKTFLQLEHKYLATGSIKYNPSTRTPSKERWFSELI
jgi:hypothetical protein